MIKKPKVAFDISSEKKPRASDQQSVLLQHPLWKVERIDYDGPWCPKIMSRDILLDVIQKLKNFESMTWPQIEAQGGHNVAVGRIIKKAQKRLIDIKIDDIDSLFSLRFSGEKRLWGIRINNVFKILWWDPNHEICPATKKHT
jgi:hypothetical protein